MKKIITLLTSMAAFATGAIAQIPNASFENWTTASGYSTPDGWDNFNPLTSSMSVYTCEQGTAGAPHGSSFLKLTTKTIGASAVPGLAMVGKYDVTTFEPKSGIPFTGRPAYLTGKWQYMAAGTGDTGRIAVYLTKWNSTTNKREPVGGVEYPLPGMVMSWASFAIPITYIRGYAPDSMIIGLISSNRTQNAVAGSYLYVDSLNFSGNVPNGITDMAGLKYSITLSPNPATDNFSIDFGVPVANDVHVQVIDMVGKVVAENTWERGKRTYSMRLGHIAQGVYLVKLKIGEAVQLQRLVIE